MNVTFDYENAIFSIQEEIGRIPDIIKKESKTVMNKTAKIVKKNVVAELSKHKSDLDTTNSNYDGTPYIHMVDDVKTSVKDDKEGGVYAIIRGGKYTSYKWHLVNNGTVNTRATHFIDNAVKASENEFNELVDGLIAKAVKDGG